MIEALQIGTGNTVVWNEAEECKTVTTTRSSKGDSRKRERGAVSHKDRDGEDRLVEHECVVSKTS